MNYVSLENHGILSRIDIVPYSINKPLTLESKCKWAGLKYHGTTCRSECCIIAKNVNHSISVTKHSISRAHMPSSSSKYRSRL